MRINHNIPALIAYNQLEANQTKTSKALEQLSSGLRINHASDDAAGLAISEKMRGQISGLQQAERNAQDGISLIQTAEGSLNEVHDMLQRMRELAVEGANGTLTQSDRSSIQDEINQLRQQIDRIGNDTNFNTTKLLNGSLSDNANIRTLYGNPSYQGGISNVQVDPASILPSGTYSLTVVTDSKELNMSGISDTYKTGLENFMLSPDSPLQGGSYHTELTAQVSGDSGSTGVTLTSSNLEDGKYWVSGAGTDANVYLLNASGTGPQGSSFGTVSGLGLGNATGAGEITQKTSYTLSVKDLNDNTMGQASGVSFGATAIDIKNASGVTLGLTVDFDNSAAGYVKRGGALPTPPPYYSFNVGDIKRTSVILKDSTNKVIDHQFVDDDRKYVTFGDTGISFSTGVLKNQDKVTNIDIKEQDSNAALNLQIGSEAGEIVTLGIDDMRSKALGVDKFQLTDAASASNAIAIIDSAIDKVSATRSKLGAYQNRMDHTVNSITSSTENLTAAESRIRDVDMAQSMTEFTKLNIINQSATAMLAQANQLPQGVLQLLKG